MPSTRFFIEQHLWHLSYYFTKNRPLKIFKIEKKDRRTLNNTHTDLNETNVYSS